MRFTEHIMLKKYLAISIFLCMSWTGLAQKALRILDVSDDKTLQAFENVSRSPLTKTISYEQRFSRVPVLGFLQLSKVLDSTATYIPLFQGVPLAAYRASKGILSTKMVSDSLRKEIPFHRSAYLFDWWIQPQFNANFGYLTQPIQSKTNALLNTQFYLRKGLVVQTGILVPLLNDVDGQSMDVRLAPTFANQFLALPKNQFLSISAGLFYGDRMGVSLQYRKVDFNKPFSYGFEAGLTRFYYFQKRFDFYHGAVNDFLLLGDVSYRVARYDLLLKATAGQFMYQDKGIRFDFVRQFSMVDIGFYAVKTGNGSTLGFNFAVPLYSKAIVQGSKARLRMVDEFRWEYNYTRGYKIAERFKAGYFLEEKLRQYHHDYWQSQLRR